MDKDTTYFSEFTVDEFVKVCSDFIEEKFLTELLTAGELAILTDESTVKAGRTQLSIFFAMLMQLHTSPRKNLSTFEN